MYCDATGNITQARGLTFVWNQRAGQLKTVSQGSTLLATYFYDYQGRRTRKITTASAPRRRHRPLHLRPVRPAQKRTGRRREPAENLRLA
jgi:hypothetical protein